MVQLLQIKPTKCSLVIILISQKLLHVSGHECLSLGSKL